MGNSSKLINNPVKIYLVWVSCVVLFCVLGIPLLSINRSGGEQVPFSLLSLAIKIFIYGLNLLSVILSFKIDWLKKYWLLNLIVFLITMAILITFG